MLTPETIRALMADPLADLDDLDHDPEPTPEDSQADIEAMLEALAEKESLARFAPKMPKGRTSAVNRQALTDREKAKIDKKPYIG